MPRPAILVSYTQLKTFLRHLDGKKVRSWALDSGAYSALTSGAKISLSDYITAIRSLEEPPAIIFSLDVIGDPEKTAENARTIWREGIEAVPTFHYGSDWRYLEELAEIYPKIALGGLVKRGSGGHGSALSWKKRYQFLASCFKRVWPKWVHGFGCCDKRLLFDFPFASVDSTTWFYGVSRYGALRFGGNYHDARKFTKLVPREKDSPDAYHAALRLNLEWHLDMESAVRDRFGPTLTKAKIEPFDLRLGVAGPELKHFGDSNA